MYRHIDRFLQSDLKLNEEQKLKLLKSYINDLKNEQIKRG
ncbi:hypothetical protein Cycma_1048 [Cyclobacterium marinum DSM 745]|uniref:Uncharacterized protein n=1 Tax=Cyclobacterium marinum (strain ATCC 25205 / DSM 745 / LMG 13164 / NCIMB 1802) TaxID=880070 RepID=G0IVQ3_CYCMS|nr:hypothetical protein Cycma_1048 [Cyclobacterium marinum DSM 745]